MGLSVPCRRLTVEEGEQQMAGGQRGVAPGTLHDTATTRAATPHACSDTRAAERAAMRFGSRDRFLDLPPNRFTCTSSVLVSPEQVGPQIRSIGRVTSSTGRPRGRCEELHQRQFGTSWRNTMTHPHEDHRAGDVESHVADLDHVRRISIPTRDAPECGTYLRRSVRRDGRARSRSRRRRPPAHDRVDLGVPGGDHGVGHPRT